MSLPTITPPKFYKFKNEYINSNAIISVKIENDGYYIFLSNQSSFYTIIKSNKDVDTLREMLNDPNLEYLK